MNVETKTNSPCNIWKRLCQRQWYRYNVSNFLLIVCGNDVSRSKHRLDHRQVASLANDPRNLLFALREDLYAVVDKQGPPVPSECRPSESLARGLLNPNHFTFTAKWLCSRTIQAKLATMYTSNGRDVGMTSHRMCTESISVERPRSWIRPSKRASTYTYPIPGKTPEKIA